MSNPLSPEEKIAQSMLLFHSKNGIESLYVLSQMAEAISDFMPDDPDEQLQGAVLQKLQGIGYAITNLNSITSQFDYLQSSHAGFWSGQYTLLDSKSNTHTLVVTDDNVRFLLNCVTEVATVSSEGAAFTQQKLQIDNDKISLALTFSSIAETLDYAQPVDFGGIFDQSAPRVEGTLLIKADNSTIPVSIKGKRGAYTAAGVNWDYDGEPPATWEGEYALQYTDQPNWPWSKTNLVIGVDTSSNPVVTYGDNVATNVKYVNNYLSGSLELDWGSADFGIVLSSTSNYHRKFYAWFNNSGQIRTATGYAVPVLQTRDSSLRLPFKERIATTARTTDKAIVKFCATPYDAIFDAQLLIGDQISSKDLFSTNGFSYNEVDAQGVETGNKVTFTTEVSDTKLFPAQAALRAYHLLGPDLEPREGLENVRVGVVINTDFELPNLVETDFYEVRTHLQNYDKIDASGLTLELAIDDPQQKRLLKIAQVDTSELNRKICSYTPELGQGPDTSVTTTITDFTKASVLIRATTGETQVVGHHSYYLAVTPKGTTGKYHITVIGQVYEKSSQKVGNAFTFTLPILMLVPIQMDSRDALEYSGTPLPPAVAGKNYQGIVAVQKGQQPFTWRLLTDQKPSGLAWSNGLAKDKDVPGQVYMTLSGKVDSGTVSGQSYASVLRVISDMSCVMKPLLIPISITTQEPDTPARSAADWLAALGAVLAIPGLVWAARKVFYRITGKDKNAADGTGANTIELGNRTNNNFAGMNSINDANQASRKQNKKGSEYRENLNKNLKNFNNVRSKSENELRDIKAKIETEKNNDDPDENKIEELEKRAKDVSNALEDASTEETYKEKQVDEGENSDSSVRV